MRRAVHALIDICTYEQPGFRERTISSPAEHLLLKRRMVKDASARQKPKYFTGPLARFRLFSENVLMESDEGIDVLFRADVAMNAHS